MDKLRVTVLYDGMEDEEQAEAEAKGEKPPKPVPEQVLQVLGKRGHEVKLLAAGAKVKNLAGQIDKEESDIVFNLCESLGGNSQHEQNVASLLELFGKHFTGAGAIGLALAQDKALTKKLLAFHGIKCPKFSVMDAGHVEWSDDLKMPLFVKPLNEDASIGIDAKAIVRNIKELMERLSYIQTEFNGPALVEEYIEGREIYVGVLGNSKPEALPIIEWDFSKLSKDTPRIASSEAKWDEDSEGYKAPEIFPEDIPEAVYKSIQDAAIVAFKTLKLRDYARVDMRLRTSNKDWEFFVIEVNPNPHLDKKSELAMAAKKHGLSFPDLVEKIIELAMDRRR